MKNTNKNHGITLLYATVAMVALTAVLSLAVDYGRVQLTKTELQRAADAGARYGAFGLKNILNGQSAAFANAVAAAGDNTADGSSVVLDPSQDIQLVIWDAASKSYSVTTDPTLANAVRVVASRTAARGNAVQMSFARLIGFNSCNVTTSAIAMLTPGTSLTYTVKATSNPFLAGMPAGSVASMNNPHNDPDYAGTSSSPLESPVQTSIPLTSGQGLTFDGVNGGANNLSSSTYFDADGNQGDIQSNYSGNDNHFGNMSAPLNSLVGVFLDDTQPDQSSTPANLDFSTPAERDFTSISPHLKQIFFIGDGRTSDGQTQEFIPPSGATRLYLATWDGYEWSNNIGSFTATVHLPGTVTMVQ